MTDTSTEAKIKGLCALHTTLARMDGHKIDKKSARWDAMTDYVLHCEAVSTRDLDQRQLIHEAVSTAIVGDPMWTGAPFDRNPWLWMEGR